MEKKDKTIIVRITERLHKKLLAMAVKTEITLSEVVRRLLDEKN